MNKKVFLFFLCFVLVSFNCAYIFADNEEPNNIQDNTLSGIEGMDNASQTPVVVDITSLLTPVTTNENEPDIVEVLEPQLVNVEVTQMRVSPSDTSGLKAVLLTILGDYETVVTDYTYQQNNYQYLSHSIQIERDWSWICSCGVFALLLYCTFRTIGGICARF